VVRLAGRQHRAVSVAQLTGAGLSAKAIAYRVEQQRLRRLWRGVYLLGPAPPEPLALAMGAVLTTGGAGVLSYGWAAWLHGFVPAAGVPVDVTVTNGSRCGRAQVKVHRARSLDRRDVTRRRGIPVTSPARTCLDLAEVLTRNALEAAVAEAQVRNVVRERQLLELIARSPGRRGIAVLSAILEVGPRFTRAESERLMLALLRAAGLPACLTNVKVIGGRYEVDFLWPDHRLIVEVDGYSTHGHRRAFENDRRRQQELVAADYRVMPVTWRQLNDEPLAVAARIAGALALAKAA
jgi:very-short-patch-repair endonuclease